MYFRLFDDILKSFIIFCLILLNLSEFNKIVILERLLSFAEFLFMHQLKN